MSSKDKSERVLFDLNQGNLPDGSQYVVSAEDVAKYEVDSSGIVRIKSDVILNNDVSKKLSAKT